MKKICSKCGKTIEYNKTCTCRTNITYNRNISPEKRKFYSSYAWQKLRNRKVKSILIVRDVGVSGRSLLLRTCKDII